MQIVSLLILAPLFLPVFTFCPFKMPYLYCFVCPVRCFWHRIRGVVLLIALGLNIKNGLFCAEICPFGTIQVILSRINPKKLNPPKFLRNIKYISAILALIIIAVTRIAQLPGQILIIRISGLLLGIFLLSIIAGIFSYRFFCQNICPVAVLTKILNFAFSKTSRRATVLLAIACLISGCRGPASSLAARPRIISLAPSITEILFALDLEENIVGVTTCCDYPAAAKNTERVATFSAQANLERILVLNPDIVFSTGLEQEPIVQKLKSLNIKVILVYPRSLSELFAGILEIGRLTRREGQAQDLVDKMKQKISRVSQKVASVPEEERPKVFVEISADPLITAGKGSFTDELITLAGGRNIAYDAQRAYSQFSPELVLKRNPDVIVLGYMQPAAGEEVARRLGWQGLSCVKNGRVVADIDPDLFLRPGPRITEGLEQIHLKLFPR